MRYPLTLLLALPLILAARPIWSAQGDHATAIPTVSSLADEAGTAQRERLPLVLMFSSDYCGYCIRVESDFLGPMQKSGDYRDRAIFRKVKLGSGTLTDFDGTPVTVDALAERYNIKVTPTVVFLDHHGYPLAESQVGLTTPDYYGGYLDQSITDALERLRRPPR